MPLYDYHCDSCGKEFEKKSSIAERNNVFCVCGEKARKKFSPVNFTFGFVFANEGMEGPDRFVRDV